ncbi:S4A5 protein, partial [Polypterus senegalus]
MDQDGLVDRGMGTARRRYEEDEDHHSIYIGVPVPRGYRRKRRRRRSTSSRDISEVDREIHYERERHNRSDTDEGGLENPQELSTADITHCTSLLFKLQELHVVKESLIGNKLPGAKGTTNLAQARVKFYRQERANIQAGEPQHMPLSPAAERLRYILGEEDDLPTPTLFTEMDTLQHDGDELEWKESARWVKFEEKVEEGGERWSKPHVSTLSLHSLFELRTCLQTGTVLLDLDGYSLPQIIDDIIEKQIQDGMIKEELREKISFVLLRKHRHQTKKPIHRSLADIGKAVSSTSSRSPSRSPSTMAAFHRSTEDLRMRQNASYGRLRKSSSPRVALAIFPTVLMCRSVAFRMPLLMNHCNILLPPGPLMKKRYYQSLAGILLSRPPGQLKNKFIKKIPRDAEASNVLIGEVDFLDKPFVAFVRLAQSTTLGGLTEVPVPTRFLFVLLGPQGKAKSYNEIGRAIATLMVDDLFSDVAYKARDRDDLIAGIDEFLDEVIVLPPGEWDPTIRIEPPKKVPSAEKRKSVFSLNEPGQMNGSAGGGGVGSEDEEMPAPHELGEELIWTGKYVKSS